jgi:phosphoribosyl-AMP cyclohydrolase
MKLELEKIKFNIDGLVPAIAQDIHSKNVLMLAWMSKESINETLKTGFAVYYSRSRQQLWLKGKNSGNLQKIINIKLDCDFDAILLEVEQTGNACHTGEKTCFFNKL